jgi:hypothetical protein
MVEFNELKCCALCKAFDENLELITEFGDFILSDRVEIYHKILVNTSRIRFPLTDETADIYRSFALTEIKRLKGLNINGRLSCSHKVAEHVKSLESVINKMNSQSN